MSQRTFADALCYGNQKVTRKQRFLDEMNRIVPWSDLVSLIQPVYPKVPVAQGTRPVGCERMLRMLFLGIWFNMSDPAVEESLHDIPAMRDFVGIDLTTEKVPDETTLCRFRKLLNEHNLCAEMFRIVGKTLEKQGIRVGTGTIVDATIIHAPTSTKNKDKKRDEEMASTKKGNQWYFGMKAHIGVDTKTGVIHTTTATAASVHDSQVLDDNLHGNETRVYGDSAYRGQEEKIHAIGAKDFTQKRAYRNKPLSEDDKAANKTKSRVRAKVEHPFRILKNIFGYTKVRYKGLVKNANHLFMAMGLVNLYMQRGHLLARCT